MADARRNSGGARHCGRLPGPHHFTRFGRRHDDVGYDHDNGGAWFELSAALSGNALGRTGWSATTDAPSSSADAPDNALDGNFHTRFSTNEDQAPGLAIRVDLGSARAFDQLAMRAPNSPNDYARGYNVLVSTNNSSWATVASCTGTANPEVVSFPTQTAQYVRVVLTAASTTNWWSIDEFDLYGSATATTTTTTTAPTTTTAAMTTTTSMTTTTASLSSSANPAAVGQALTYTVKVAPILTAAPSTSSPTGRQ